MLERLRELHQGLDRSCDILGPALMGEVLDEAAALVEQVEDR